MRKSFSKSQCEEILENQDGKCSICSTRFFGKNKVRPQYDHINGDHSDNRVENGQAICANCHDAKSRKENVKRSIQDLDRNFVKYCPICGKKTKGKDYKDINGNRLTTDYLSANYWVNPCTNCKSVFKVIRADSKVGKKKLAGKKLDDGTRHCINCGGQFEDKIKSNVYVECLRCHTTFAVWIKKYSEWSLWLRGLDRQN